MESRCRHIKDDGERCGVTWGLSDAGLCLHHDPERAEEVMEARRRGGRATARKLHSPGLAPSDLPPLDSPQAASKWLAIVGEAVATGRLGHREGATVVRAVEAFLKSHDAGEVTERLEDLMDALAEWRKTGDPAPVLRLVKDGKR